MASDVEVAVITAPPPFDGAGAAPVSAVSWPAIFAGAFVAAALGIVLIILGSGFGLASVRPWPGAGASAAKFSVMTGIWLIIVQWLASGLGGYLTGRLRTRWLGTHSHEVHFRDTAHGFLTWAVATVMVVLLAAGAASLAAGAHARTAATASAAAAGPYTDEVDALFRSAHPDGGPASDAARGEAARFLAKASLGTPATADDRSWLAAMVTDRTGIAPADAVTKVDVAIAGVRDHADKARKAASAAAICMALALLVGAFIASVAAALGGQQRDEHP
jgi:hypothetical protein